MNLSGHQPVATVAFASSAKKKSNSLISIARE